MRFSLFILITTLFFDLVWAENYQKNKESRLFYFQKNDRDFVHKFEHRIYKIVVFDKPINYKTSNFFISSFPYKLEKGNQFLKAKFFLLRKKEKELEIITATNKQLTKIETSYLKSDKRKSELLRKRKRNFQTLVSKLLRFKSGTNNNKKN